MLAGGTAAFPEQGDDPTGAGDHPAAPQVEVSLDDQSFAHSVEASYDSLTGEWSVPLHGVAAGDHTLYARARLGERTSPVDSVSFTVRPGQRVEWQIVDRNSAPDPAAWRDADGFAAWSFSFDTADHGNGAHTIVTRVVSDGLAVAQTSAAVTFR